MSNFKYGLEHNGKFCRTIALTAKVSHLVLKYDFRTKFVSKIILIIKWDIRVIVRKYGDTFG